MESKTKKKNIKVKRVLQLKQKKTKELRVLMGDDYIIIITMKMI